MGITISILTEGGAEVQDLGIGLNLRLGLQQTSQTVLFCWFGSELSLCLGRYHTTADTLAKSELQPCFHNSPPPRRRHSHARVGWSLVLSFGVSLLLSPAGDGDCRKRRATSRARCSCCAGAALLPLPYRVAIWRAEVAPGDGIGVTSPLSPTLSEYGLFLSKSKQPTWATDKLVKHSGL